jgi:uncharacterized membrane protein (DUF4010 family)
MEVFNYIPQEIINFLLVAIFSLLIGFEQRRHHRDEKEDLLFGTDRTFTFIGILGYVLLLADTTQHLPFIAGLFVVGGLLAISYYHKVKNQSRYGLTTVILALLTYCLPVMVVTQPVWLSLMFVVTILVITELKDNFINLSRKISGDEFITLAKFIVFAGIILPLLPHTDISPEIKISPYQVWLAIVVVSGISYGSYLLKKFVFPASGLLFSGVLGGLYSSTATTVIIARKEKQGNIGNQAVSAIMLATGMMYLRILVLAFIFNTEIAKQLFLPFIILFAITVALAFIGKNKKTVSSNDAALPADTAIKNPLEFKTALIFGILFVFFAALTQYVVTYYGNAGVTSMAYIVGVTDIDPFLLNLLQQKGSDISQSVAALAIINATNSNNLIKMLYALTLSGTGIRKQLLIAFGTLIITGIIISLVLYV